MGAREGRIRGRSAAGVIGGVAAWGLFLTVAGPASGAQEPGAEKGLRLRSSGFVEGRFTNLADAAGGRGPAEWQVTRLRLTLDAALAGRLRARVQGNLTTRGDPRRRASARDAYLEYDAPGIRVRAGQTKVPFGFEVYEEGDEVRPALERARVFGLVFPDERDVGLVLSTEPQDMGSGSTDGGTALAVGVLNGAGINRWSGETAGRSAAARGLVSLRRTGVVGVSLYAGTSPAGDGRPVPKRAAGVEYRGRARRLSAAAEYVSACTGGKDLYGGYGQAAYDTGGGGGMVFARYDFLDPDRRTAVPDRWSRTGLGWFRDFGKLRATIEYDFVRDRLGAPGAGRPDTFGGELQLRF